MIVRVTITNADGEVLNDIRVLEPGTTIIRNRVEARKAQGAAEATAVAWVIEDMITDVFETEED